ncbi:MAG: DUF2807 domain-containing protein [Bacteroidales bacterium]|nr:DUF2807 domain-containing protein [Bacteroidales bacterium]
MKKLVAFLLIIAGCIHAYPQTISTYDSLNSISVYDGIIINIERSDSNVLSFVKGTITENDLELKYENNALSIRLKPEFRSNGQVALLLKYKSLHSVSGFGKAEITGNNLLISDSLSIEFKSGAMGYIDMDVKKLHVYLVEGALFQSEGYAVDQRIYVYTNATFSGFKLEGDTGTVVAGSTAKAKINISKELDAVARSKGYIGYKGQPNFTRRKTILGEIIPAD